MDCSTKGKTYVQGSTYTIAWKLYKNERGNRVLLTNKNVRSIEFSIGAIHKYYPKDVTYSSELQAFLVNLSQKDTLSMPPGKALRFARVKWDTGQVKSTPAVVDNVKKLGARTIL